MGEKQKVTGGIIVHTRNVLYSFKAGDETVTLIAVDGTYTGDVDGPAVENFVAQTHADGSQTHYGWGEFRGRILGQPGVARWKFKGKRGSGDIELIEGGTEGLAGLLGDIYYEIKPGSDSEFTYEGTVWR